MEDISCQIHEFNKLKLYYWSFEYDGSREWVKWTTLACICWKNTILNACSNKYIYIYIYIYIYSPSFRNTANDRIEQELIFVGSESGKLLAVRNLFSKVSLFNCNSWFYRERDWRYIKRSLWRREKSLNTYTFKFHPLPPPPKKKKR